MSKKDLRVIHDERNGRFRLMVNGEEASYVAYEAHGDFMEILSTYTRPQYRGRGLASRLLRAVAKYAEEKALKIRPICSYAVRFFQKHPEYSHVVRWR